MSEVEETLTPEQIKEVYHKALKNLQMEQAEALRDLQDDFALKVERLHRWKEAQLKRLGIEG